MTLNFPSTPTSGQLYTDPNAVIWRYDGVKWNVERGTSYKTFSGAKINLTSEYSLTSSSTAIVFDNEIIDIDGYYNINTPSRITIPESAFYRINFSAYTNSSGASYTITLRKNNSVVLSSVTISPNQYTNFDEIVNLTSGDYLEIYASETQGIGSLTTSTFFEISRAGYSMGTAVSAATAFSGVRGTLDSSYSVTSSPTAISWNSTAFNQNADASGAFYWDENSPTRFTVSIGGFYRIKGIIIPASSENYTISLRKNGSTTLASTVTEAFETAQIDEIYEFNSTDYVEILINDTNSTGSLTTDTYLEMIRIGV